MGSEGWFLANVGREWLLRSEAAPEAPWFDVIKRDRREREEEWKGKGTCYPNGAFGLSHGEGKDRLEKFFNDAWP